MGGLIGDYAVIADTLSFTTGLQIIIQQVEVIKRHCLKGAMIAVLDDLKFYETNDFLRKNTELAAINFPTNFVVSTTEKNLTLVTDYLKNNNISFQQLPVSYAFHSSWIDSAKSFFLDTVSKISLKNPLLPLISCVRASQLDNVTFDYFWDVIRMPILFQKTIQKIEENHSVIYIDVGPSGTLATSVKYNLSKESMSKYFSILTPYGFDIKNFDSVLQKVHSNKE